MIVLPEWWSAIESVEQFQQLLCELNKELTPSHTLFGADCQPVAFCVRSDDVLFQVNSTNIRFAMVHLTWSGQAEFQHCPATMFFSSYEEFLDSMKYD